MQQPCSRSAPSVPRLVPIRRTIQPALINPGNINLIADILLSRPQSHTVASIRLPFGPELTAEGAV
jgi:hypothetical protein